MTPRGLILENLPKVVQFLADNGAKIDIWNKKNNYGWTPLLIAVPETLSLHLKRLMRFTR